MPALGRSGVKSKKLPLSRYLKDYKYSQSHCGHCDKTLDRIILVFRGKIINKKAIFADIEQPINHKIWIALQSELIALCRFCSRIYCNARNGYFNIMAFKQYLFSQTEMSQSTVREYVTRLRRLDDRLLTGHQATDQLDGNSIEQRIISELPAAMHNSYCIALRKYQQYLAWQKITSLWA